MNGEQRAPLVFVDCETTGLDPDAQPWEVYALRRDPDGTDRELHLFVRHDPERAARLPARFREDYAARYTPADAVPRPDAAGLLARFLHTGPDAPAPHLVGVNPAYDAAVLGRLLLAHSHPLPWSHHLVDVLALAAGFLAGRGHPAPPPWRSDDLSAAVGVDVPTETRHTARGDALWALALYDAITTPDPLPLEPTATATATATKEPAPCPPTSPA
ncbi:hypothetical protein Cch01nite_24870 [Cellulomonas chitinilytica]|uniref:Exonuclease domain-containing protein n=1 Tax=Cellulomonas chitinilytica TaxID=398759 RepID=A0A919P4H0_9CELL|nr:hypothetical protein [Cellulomonas chitinilytica]GIG21763.1 hypothetical protein Cch01nite_24870 [Cellulomonas chitinilytica]